MGMFFCRFFGASYGGKVHIEVVANFSIVAMFMHPCQQMKVGRHLDGPIVLNEVVMVAHLVCNNSLPHRGLFMGMDIHIT